MLRTRQGRPRAGFPAVQAPLLTVLVLFSPLTVAPYGTLVAVPATRAPPTVVGACRAWWP
ncbi:hypothetical protein ACGF4C_00235 [Streptomyces sp. NPDC048197]|uniref:hypothetical protein n=1 Tax=Streptomyces sp. NPDC048197 TaxID=3365511 RepID=UPI00371DDCF7